MTRVITFVFVAAAFYEEENIVFLFGGYSQAGGCQYFNLTSKTLVEFTCMESARNITVVGTYGAFVPATRSFYLIAVYIQQLYSGNITLATAPIQMPVAAPVVDNMPVGDVSPVSNGQPSTEDEAPMASDTPVCT